MSFDRPIAAFWHRLWALAMDMALLAGLGFALGSMLEDALVQMGSGGRLVGLGIAVLYFGILNSHIAGGQTFGKRILDIRVVDKQQRPLTLKNSGLRALVLATPFSLNTITISEPLNLMPIQMALSAIVIGGIISTLYLFVFNRRTRQSLHDLVCGSYVIETTGKEAEVSPIWGFHTGFVALCFCITLVAPLILHHQYSGVVNVVTGKDMDGLHTALVQHPKIQKASIVKNFTQFYSANSTEVKLVRAMLVQVFVSDKGAQTIAPEVFKLLMDRTASLTDIDTLTINITYGYDIGIWSSIENTTLSLSHDQMKQFLPEEINT